jgi:hypothetical protein
MYSEFCNKLFLCWLCRTQEMKFLSFQVHVFAYSFDYILHTGKKKMWKHLTQQISASLTWHRRAQKDNAFRQVFFGAFNPRKVFSQVLVQATDLFWNNGHARSPVALESHGNHNQLLILTLKQLHLHPSPSQQMTTPSFHLSQELGVMLACFFSHTQYDQAENHAGSKY